MLTVAEAIETLDIDPTVLDGYPSDMLVVLSDKDGAPDTDEDYISLDCIM